MGKSHWLSSVMSGRTSTPDAPTPESIEAAKQRQAKDREQVFEKTGVLVQDDGHVLIVSAGGEVKEGQ